MLRALLECSSQALAIALLAFATLAYTPPSDWLAACVDHGMSIVDDFDAQAVANAVWALGLLDHLPAYFWSALMKPFEAALKGLKGKHALTYAPYTSLLVLNKALLTEIMA